MEIEDVTLRKIKKTDTFKNDVNINGSYSNDSIEFIMSVKVDHTGILEDMFRMFINYFALIKLEHKDVPEWIELRLKDLRPMALVLSKELIKAWGDRELNAQEYLDHQTEQRFQFLQSHFDKLV